MNIKLHILYIIGLFLFLAPVPMQGDEREEELSLPLDSTVWNQDPLGLQTVVVTATRTPKALKDIPVVTRVITAEDIKKLDATNVRDLLQQELPGLEFTYSMGHQVLNMGGYDGNNILFLVDGERMAGESVDNIDFARLDMSSVERIEIVKGAASTLYGSAAMGGVVNIITKAPADHWTANLNSRYEGVTKEWRHGANANFNIGKVNSLTTFQMTDADSLSLHGEQSSLNTAYANRTYNIKERLIWDVTDNLRLTGRAGYFFRERDSSPQTHERYRDLNYGLRANYYLAPRQTLEVAYSFDQYDKSDLAMLTHRDVRDYSNRQNIGRILYNVKFPAWHSLLTAGADYMNDYLLSYQFSDDQKSHIQNSYDAFVQWDYSPNDHWDIIGGLRYDYFSASAKGMPTWKLAGMYKTGKHTFRAAYASGFRAPSLKELHMDFFMGSIFMIYGNPDLECETNHHLSLSWSNFGSLTDNLKYCITATGYYNFFHNYITTATVQRNGAYGLQYTNVANQRIAGGDLSLQLHDHSGFSTRLSAAYVKPMVDNGVPDLTTARPLSLTWRVEYDHQFTKNYGFNIALTGRFLSAVTVTEYATTLPSTATTSAAIPQLPRLMMPNVTQTQSVRYPHYSLWKLSLSQRLFKAFTVNAAIDNLFNYRPHDYYANSPLTTGTTATIGLSIDLDKF